MKKNTLLIIAIIVVVIAIPVFLFIGSYNSLVNLSEGTNGKWANVETQLQRRADLIPNLVKTVERYTKHEKEVLTSLAEARAKLAGANTPEDAANANQQLSTALSRLLLVVENYPDLKADKSFINLQDELAGTENRIQNARDDYNNAVQSYNKKIKSFPTNMIAGLFNFESKEYFKANDSANEVPDVNFNE